MGRGLELLSRVVLGLAKENTEGKPEAAAESPPPARVRAVGFDLLAVAAIAIGDQVETVILTERFQFFRARTIVTLPWDLQHAGADQWRGLQHADRVCLAVLGEAVIMNVRWQARGGSSQFVEVVGRSVSVENVSLVEKLRLEMNVAPLPAEVVG